MPVYKLLRATEWAAFSAQGSLVGSPLDLADGYVHLSTALQAEETARRHFAGEEGLRLVAVDEARLAPDLRWEPSRGGDLFPHLYREMRASDVLWSAPLPLVDGRHEFPPL